MLEVEVQKAVESAMDKYASDIKDTLAKKEIPFQQAERNSAGKISILLADAKANDRFNQIRSDQFANLKVASFVEREGKYQYLLDLNSKEIKSIEDSAVRQGLETIRNRIDQFGVTEPAIAPQGRIRFSSNCPASKILNEPSS